MEYYDNSELATDKIL